MAGTQAFEAKRGTIFMFDPEDLILIDDKDHPLFDPRALEPPRSSMVASIKARGVLQPILVVRGPKGEPIVAAGRRRTVNAREANRQLKAEGLPPKQVPAVFRREEGAESIALMVIENSHREDESVTARAEKARRAITAGYSEVQVAELFGVTAATVRAWMYVGNLHPKVREALDAGTVRVTDAVRELAKLPKGEQAEALEKLQEERPTRKARREAAANGAPVERKPAPVTPAKRLKWIEEAVNADPGVLSASAITLVQWISGVVTDDSLARQWPGLASVVRR